MSVDYYKDRPFRVSENEDGVVSGIEMNPCDSGKTETAWVEIIDDETESISARVTVQVHKQAIPHTESEKRIFSEEDLTIELLNLDEGAVVSSEIIQKLLDETDAVKHLHRICFNEDSKDRLDDDVLDEEE